MKSVLQRMFAVVLALSLAPWAQGEFCPMKMQSPAEQACATPAVNRHVHHVAQQTAPGHDCCPHAQAQKTQGHPQCPPVKVTACSTAMTCCSTDQQPGSSPRTVSVEHQPTVIGTIRVSGLTTPPRSRFAVCGQIISLDNTVFRLKEDLRI